MAEAQGVVLPHICLCIEDVHAESFIERERICEQRKVLIKSSLRCTVADGQWTISFLIASILPGFWVAFICL